MKKEFQIFAGIFSMLFCLYASNSKEIRNNKTEPLVLANFTEESDFVTSEEFSSLLGYSSVSIKGGSYQIIQNEDGTIVATLDLKGLVDDEVQGDFDDAFEDGFGESTVQIRIAKRICKRHKKACHCGVGFRCGTTTAILQYEDGNTLLDLRVGVDQKNMKIKFLLPSDINVEELLDEE